MSEEWSSIPPIWDRKDVQAISDHALEKLATLLIRKATVVEALYGHGANQAGKIHSIGATLGVEVLYDDDETFWEKFVHPDYPGSDDVVLSEETGTVHSGSSALKTSRIAGAWLGIGFQHIFPTAQNWLLKDSFNIWHYGTNDNNEFYCEIVDENGKIAYFMKTDDQTGWMEFILDFANPDSEESGFDWTKIKSIRIYWAYIANDYIWDYATLVTTNARFFKNLFDGQTGIVFVQKGDYVSGNVSFSDDVCVILERGVQNITFNPSGNGTVIDYNYDPPRINGKSIMVGSGGDMPGAPVCVKIGSLYYVIDRTGQLLGTGNIDAASSINSALSNGEVCILAADTEFLISGTIGVYHGQMVKGFGESSVIKQADGANLDRMIFIAGASASLFGRQTLSDFYMDGNKANQTNGNGIGIETDTYSSIEGDYVTIENIKIFNCRGQGIKSNGNWYLWKNVHIRSCGTTSSHHGFEVLDYHNVFLFCTAVGNKGCGFYLAGTGLHHTFGCRAWKNEGDAGVYMGGVSTKMRHQWISGEIVANKKHGFLVERGHNIIANVNLISNGELAADTYDHIHFNTSSAINNKVSVCIFEGGTYERYCVAEYDTNPDKNTVEGCTVVDAGQSGKFDLKGAESWAKNNMGYNPVGYISPDPTWGGSPWTFTNDKHVPIDIYVSGGTITSITKGGQNLGITSGMIHLEPNESIVITYTGAGTIKVFGQ